MVSIKQKLQHGFGLVELMISITLGLVLSAAVIQVFVASNTSSTLQQSLAQVQENARFGMRLLGEEIRMSGYMGCTSIGTVTVNNIATPAAAVDFGPATVFVGQNDLAEGNALGAIEGSDAVQIKRASTNFIRLDGSTTAGTGFLNINSNTLGFVQDDYVLVSDCLNADVFRITNTPAQSGVTTLNHENGAKNSASTLGKIYGLDAEVFGFETKNYFIRDTGRDTQAGNPIHALYVQQTVAGSGGVMSAATELVEGVEDMQISYGVDNSGDRSVDVYTTVVANWANVLSVKISLQMVGSEENVVGQTGSATAQSVTDVDGNVLVNNDGRLRQVFTNVFAIRNKVP
ncbi:Uncharacterised protein [Zhongshania aliphaticivorans]|uniref:Type IV pilus assembly protein PilW n=1 Tax=Zhongshania aliphaticivorans TaxID=1470434 RepID=A0A5S9QGA4_9GAMM|nr:PilW family protein [Zhongshania aliphaticivorans]CAA0109405.1 Uncharacterised protein [Zhongshania aliphaticivorans]CAA0117618.1 Uncharacterised protein [Zhongshania aliphaticivorans]